jgi:preprotein translocase subunit SecY
MFEKINRIFKIEELRNKILFILGAFVVFRIMANIPIPGIDTNALKTLFEQFEVLGLMNVFTGGALENLSIAMLGVGPYITATIILQLLTMIFPQLEELYKDEGEEGRRKFEQWGRIAAVPLALLQGFAMISLLNRQGVIGDLGLLEKIGTLVTIATGSIVLMWLGELISEKGIGRGISLLIFAGIVADFPRNFGQLIAGFSVDNLVSYIIFLIASLVVITGVVIVNEARRNVPVSYAKRVRGRKIQGGASTYLPINVNPAGVIPIIFALSVLTFPSMIANLLSGNEGFLGTASQTAADFFNNPLINKSMYFVLIFLFTYFYTLITFDPEQISENLKQMGGFIPGIRPGKQTAKHLQFILNRILPFGALFLSLIAVMPSLVQAVTGITAFNFLIGGTSIIILVSVVLDIKQQVEAQLEMRNYQSF